MRVLLTESCCGKTSLNNDNYVDFDIFVSMDYPNKELIQSVLKAFMEVAEDKVYMMNTVTFFTLDFHKLEKIKIERIILPELSELNIAYRKKILAERDMKKYKTVRVKSQERMKAKYEKAYRLIREFFPEIKIETLGIGQFLCNILNKTD